MVTGSDVFSPEEVERARRYHRPLYLALVLDLSFGPALLSVLSFTRAGRLLLELTRGPWWARTAELAALVVLGTTALRLPLLLWRGWAHERAWGFSTQSVRSWLADRAKGLGVALVLTLVFTGGLVGLAHGLPSLWPAVAAPLAAALVLGLSFAAPLLLEPLFNRFEPLADETLAGQLHALADRAGVPVRDVLVCDASRRTRKANAYVSGLGRTRRVVLYDTLLERSSTREVKLVVAHELGHRQRRHVVKGTLLGAGGAALYVLVLWALAWWTGRSVGDPLIVPFALLVGEALELAGLPVGAAVSRRWEREADRISLELTRDGEAFESAHRDLAKTNLADLDPPRALYVLLFSHPTPPERIAAARGYAG